MHTRTIRNEKLNLTSKNIEIKEIPGKSVSLHPVSLELIDNKTIDPICLTKFHLDDKNKLASYSNYKCKTNADKYKQYMHVPPISISSSDILKIYDINSIDSLYEWISTNYETTNYFTINRVLNCWIKNNFDTLKIANDFIEKILKKIIIRYFNPKLLKDINLDKVTKDYIDYWIEKHDANEFSLDLLSDLHKYIEKKNK